MANVTFSIRVSPNGKQHASHPAGDFGVTTGGGGGGGGTPPQQPSIVILPQNRFWLGDSQIRGRANGLTVSNGSAFAALWTSTMSDPQTNTTWGIGGRSLLGHLAYIQSQWGTSTVQRPGPEWVHWVETGEQNLDGQRTPAEYQTSVLTLCRWLKQKSPNCLISCETPFSFGRESEAYRNWSAYVPALYAARDILASEDITLHVVDNNGRILALCQKLGNPAVYYVPPDPRQYHFTDVGNLMTAMAIYWQLGYSVEDLDITPILNEGYVSLAQYTACLDVFRGV